MAIQPTDPIGEVMRCESVCIDRRASLRAAAEVMADQDLGALVVLGREGLVGIVSERDVVRALAGGADPDATCVAGLMTEHPVSVSSDGSVIEVARAMLRVGVHHIPLLKDGEPVGMASALGTLEIVLDCWAAGD